MFLQKNTSARVYAALVQAGLPASWADKTVCWIGAFLQLLVRAAFPHWLPSLKEGWLLVKQNLKLSYADHAGRLSGAGCSSGTAGRLWFLRKTFWEAGTTILYLRDENLLFLIDPRVVLQLGDSKDHHNKGLLLRKQNLIPSFLSIQRSCKPRLFAMDLFGLEMIAHR